MNSRVVTKRISRRHILTLIGGVCGASAASPKGIASSLVTTRSLVPKTLATAPNYWCTWAAQNYLYAQGTREFDPIELEGAAGAVHAQTLLNERVLMRPDGWAKVFHPRIRQELYLLLDDGWQEGGTDTFQLDRSKFPSFIGPAEQRLRDLNNAVRADGWRALALWCRFPPDYSKGGERCVSWNKRAGIPYLKIDGGDQAGILTRARAHQDASITLEHIHGEPCLNGDWRREGRFDTQIWGCMRLEILRKTDVYRTYDATAILGIPTTLDRAVELLKGVSGHPEVAGILNVEDEVYLAAVLGCSMGVLRHPLRGLRPNNDEDVFFPATRQLKRRMDEVVRAVRWQRIAPPLAAGEGTLVLDSQRLVDEWTFKHGETFDPHVVGNRARQSAPARVARNMELPSVSCKGDLPYVACTRFQNGAAAIGAFERVVDRAFQPKADVAWKVGDISGPFGIFGRFRSLTLIFDRQLRPGRVLAQDLAGDSPIDITDEVSVGSSEVTLPGALIDRIGRSSGTQGDLSMPGLVLAI